MSKIIQIPPFYPGQAIAAAHASLFFDKGDGFCVIDIKRICCYWGVHIGFLIPRGIGFLECRCSKIAVRPGDPFFIDSVMFTAVDMNFQPVTFAEIMTIEQTVPAN